MAQSGLYAVPLNLLEDVCDDVELPMPGGVDAPEPFSHDVWNPLIFLAFHDVHGPNLPEFAVYGYEWRSVTCAHAPLSRPAERDDGNEQGSRIGDSLSRAPLLELASRSPTRGKCP